MSTPSTGTAAGTAAPEGAAGQDRAAFDKTAPARSAMKPEDAPQYTLDAFYAAGKALWIAPRVAAYRGEQTWWGVLLAVWTHSCPSTMPVFGRRVGPGRARALRCRRKADRRCGRRLGCDRGSLVGGRGRRTALPR